MIPSQPKPPPAKVTVKIKTEDTTIKEEFLIYDGFALHYDDPVLKMMVEMTEAKYSGKLVDPDITITSKLTWVKDA